MPRGNNAVVHGLPGAWWAVRAPGGASSILNAGDKLERVVEAANFAVQTLVEDQGVTLVVGNLAGEVNKATLLLKITKK